jgi:hypothetical protein
MLETEQNEIKRIVMPELVKIPAATADIVMRFDRPYIGLLVGEKVKVFEALVTALLPFGFRLANTEIIAGGKPAEERVVIRIPERGITFQFGAEEYQLTKDGAAWSTAAEDAAVWNAAETAFITGSRAVVVSCTATLAVHLLPLSKTRAEVIAPFISAPFNQLADKQPKAFGAHIRFADGGEVLFDYSVPYANGIFLRLSTHLEGKPSIPDILAKMRTEQQHVLKILDVRDETEENE